MISAYTINTALNYAIRTAAAQWGKSKIFSRKSPSHVNHSYTF